MTNVPPATEARADASPGAGALMRQTNNPTEATMWLHELNDARRSSDYSKLSDVQKATIDEQYNNLRDQLNAYHSSPYRNHFAPIDTDSVVSQVNTFGQASAAIKSAVQPIFQRVNELSDGAMSKAQEAVDTAKAAMENARNSVDFDAASRSLNKAHDTVDNLLNAHTSGINANEVTQAKQAWGQAKKLDTLHAAFEHMMNGVTDEETQQGGLQRVMTGNAQHFQDWLTDPGNQKMLDDLVGKDSRTNLKELSLLMSKVTSQRHTAEAAKNISWALSQQPLIHGKGAAGLAGAGLLAGHFLGYGTLGGALAGVEGIRYVMRDAATNPSVGKWLRYAVQNNIRPDVYAPLIARTIAEKFRDVGQLYQPDEEQQQGTGPPPGASSNTMATPNPKGLIEAGNLDIRNRPVIQNADGTHSSEYSISIGDDKGEVLIPTVVNGKFLTPDGKKPPEGSAAEKQMFKRAEDHYRQTGEHLGIFDTPDNADAYSQILHNRGQR
jgi:hypothetical protein